MINVLIPLSGKNTFSTSKISSFPRILNEVGGQLLLEKAAKPFTDLRRKKQITIAVPRRESEKYKLNNVCSLLGEDITTCTINGNTQGAACSSLLAIESLSLDDPLIISSFEQVLDFKIDDYIDTFISESVDAGVLTFEAIHPKWSYVKTDKLGYVTQAAEKTPISKQAIAGLYYFKSARLFVESAKSMISKGVSINDSFFISPTLNEVILNEGVVKAIGIDKSKYFHISDDHELEAYELKASEGKLLSDNEDTNKVKETIREMTEAYAKAFNDKDIESVKKFLDANFILTDPACKSEGKEDVLTYLNGIFSSSEKINFLPINIFVTDNMESIIEFSLSLDDNRFLGTDIIKWSQDFLMISMNAYLHEV